MRVPGGSQRGPAFVVFFGLGVKKGSFRCPQKGWFLSGPWGSFLRVLKVVRVCWICMVLNGFGAVGGAGGGGTPFTAQNEKGRR